MLIERDHIQIIRPATQTETRGRKPPYTAIIMEAERIYVHGYFMEIFKKIKSEKCE